MNIEEWEEECDKCCGSGIWCNERNEECSFKSNITLASCYNVGNDWDNPCICPKCKGVGKIDFIEKIVGKKVEHYALSIPTSNISYIQPDVNLKEN